MERPPIEMEVDGSAVSVPDDGATLLAVLRDVLDIRSPKDGCSPQGQCGCCTVLVDGKPRVACVTPARRVRDRSVTTLDGLDPATRTAWAEAFATCGASQCGFCTPGIIMRFEGLRTAAPAGAGPTDDAGPVEQALLAHLCRCTGWRTILEAWRAGVGRLDGPTDRAVELPTVTRTAGGETSDAGVRAEIEGRSAQQVGPAVAAGHGGFADDTAPLDALVAVPDGVGGWAVGETLAEARAAAGKVQGRRTTGSATPPLALPAGDWDVTLRTSWVEPAYLETDASWCDPGGEPRSPLANGGAFGGKVSSPAPAAARLLADRHGRPVRVVLSREDTVRMGPKRPPMAAGVRRDGTGIVRVVRTPGIAEIIAGAAPGLRVEEIDVPGPPTSTDLRAAGWAEALILLAATRTADQESAGEVTVTSPDGAVARAEMSGGADPRVHVVLRCGRPLDETVLRSYCIGAAHMALGWVTSEGISVDPDGVVHDLTVRSFGVLRAVDTPPIEVEIEADDGPPVNGSDAVFTAVAAACWMAQGRPTDWPTGIPLRARS